MKEGHVRVILRRGVRKSQYELMLEIPTEDMVRLMQILHDGKTWFTYQTPFGEPRLVNVARFDVIDFKHE